MRIDLNARRNIRALSALQTSMRSSSRLFAALLLVFVLATLPTPAAAFLHDPAAADASGTHLRSAAVLSANPIVTVVAHTRPKSISHVGSALVASCVERIVPSLRFELVCYFAKPLRAVDLRGRVYDATGPPLAPTH